MTAPDRTTQKHYAVALARSAGDYIKASNATRDSAGPSPRRGHAGGGLDRRGEQRDGCGRQPEGQDAARRGSRLRLQAGGRRLGSAGVPQGVEHPGERASATPSRSPGTRWSSARWAKRARHGRERRPERPSSTLRGRGLRLHADRHDVVAAGYKASNTRATPLRLLGRALRRHAGRRLRGESGSATGVNGDQADTSAAAPARSTSSRAAGGTWSQQAYVKASNTRASAIFGVSVACRGRTRWRSARRASEQRDGRERRPGRHLQLDRRRGLRLHARRRDWTQQAYVKAFEHAFPAR